MQIRGRRTARDFACFVQHLVDNCYLEARIIRVMLDNLNNRTFAALNVTFSRAEARRLARKLEFHVTQAHWR